MIVGIGNDIIEIERIAKACHSEAFLHYVYTEKERERFASSPASLAGNFAVKESVAKSLGTGFRGFGPADIEVLRDSAGRPYIRLYKEAAAKSEELGIKNWWISISHSKNNAVAMAIAEK